MKKIIPFLSILFVFNIASAQTISKTPAKPKLTENDLLMCDKAWHAVSVEEWGVVTKPPGEKNKNDMIRLNADGTFNLVLFGDIKSGTWTKAGQYIYCTDETTKEKISYKVVSMDASKLKLDYRDPDETHSIFEMEPK